MEITIRNNGWIDLKKSEDMFYLVFCGDNGNSIVVEDITLRHIKNLRKELERLLENEKR